jgi:hypothetical protein
MLKRWASRIPRTGIPPAVAATTRRLRYLLVADAADQPFFFNSKKFDMPHTTAAPAIPTQVSGFHPASLDEILYPWAIASIRSWFACELADLKDYAQDPPARCWTNKPLLIDQEASFWDLQESPPCLMRRDTADTPRLNASAVRAAAGPDYPDQELLDCIEFGVHMHACCSPAVHRAAAQPPFTRRRHEPYRRRHRPDGGRLHALGACLSPLHPGHAPPSGGGR